MTNQDPRIAELEQLAREEGITLPLPADYIVWLERRGRIVCLMTGQVFTSISATPTPSAKAVTYLLSSLIGELVI
jgi:hypothetical protein